VNKATDFEYYLNSKKGALGALDSKKANCCDQAHLVVALLRASGIPARYTHCKPCKFLSSGMVVGHVWAEAQIDGKWAEMDTTSNQNNVGAVNSFEKIGNPKFYDKLPF
jgi:transglutaminase-like putative cysteine protease